MLEVCVFVQQHGVWLCGAGGKPGIGD